MAAAVPGAPAPPASTGILPAELTAFIGREREVAAIRTLVAEARLVTLTGSAGTGKTRLAREVVAVRPPDAVPTRWVELASLRDPALVPAAVGEALGLREEVRAGDVAGLARMIGAGPVLLVLDNCEHLVEACADLADRLLRECDGVSILATSREALGIRGERAWLVPPLTLPAPDDPAPAGAEAVRLFVDRARDVVPGFELTPGNTPAVVEICRRLDGVPLAIELAGARVRVLSPEDIRGRLDDVFRLLSSGGRTTVPRHRTLRAAIDWSHDLLIDDARTLFHRLAVFRGGFGLDAAERVAAGTPIAEEQVLELVARLVDRSLLDVGEHHGATRYGFLEAVRQYATEKLVASDEEAAVRERHARWVLALAEEAAPHFIRPERRAWVERLQVDLDNIRSALGWSRDHAPALHVRLVGTLWWFWFSTRHWTEGGRWIEGALALPEAGPPTRDRAALLFAAGALAALQVRTPAARPLLEEAIELAGSLGDEELRAYALNYLGLTYAGEGSPESVARAVELCGRAEAWFRAHDDLYGLRLAALLLGSAAVARGDLETAEAKNLEGVRVARIFGQSRELAIALQNLAVVYLSQGRLDAAESLVREALAASRDDPSHYFIATGIAYLGEVEAGRGRYREAARLLGAAGGLRQRVGAAPFPIDASRQEAAVRVARERLGDPAFEAAWQAGADLDPDALLAELAATGEEGRVADLEASPGSPAAPDRPLPADIDLRVDALGPLAVHVDGVRLDPEVWVYGKPRELLTFLLLHPTGATRDQIGGALWPGAARSNVKNSFHVTLHHLRKALGHPEWVVTEADRYRLAPSLRWQLDADVFEAAAREALRSVSGTGWQGDGPGGGEASLRAALALYRGDLLEGETAGRWIDAHRDRLRRLQVELTLALGRTMDVDRPDEAAELYYRLALREELDEEVHRRLMAAWNQAGNRVAALRHYERVVELLRTELDADPEPETVAVYEAIRAG